MPWSSFCVSRFCVLRERERDKEREKAAESLATTNKQTRHLDCATKNTLFLMVKKHNLHVCSQSVDFVFMVLLCRSFSS